MKKFLVSIAIIPLSGCLQMFSPVVMPLDGNTYLLQAQGNTFASMSSLQAKLNKKAEDVCKGKGFEVISENGSTTNLKHYDANVVGPIPVRVNTMLLKIQCNT